VKLGRTFAQRYGIGGTWGKENNISSSFGINDWTMFNEADLCGIAYGKQEWNITEYYWAVLGINAI
jgi:hypothetical protein